MRARTGTRRRRYWLGLGPERPRALRSPRMTPFPILVSSAGRRGALVAILRRSLANLGLTGPILASDVSGYAAAFHLADRGIVVPPQSDAGFVDALLEICEREQVRLVVPTHDGELPLLAAARDRFAAVGTTVSISDARDDRDRPRQGADARLADRARLPDRPPGHRVADVLAAAASLAVAADREAALRARPASASCTARRWPTCRRATSSCRSSRRARSTPSTCWCSATAAAASPCRGGASRCAPARSRRASRCGTPRSSRSCAASRRRCPAPTACSTSRSSWPATSCA